MSKPYMNLPLLISTLLLHLPSLIHSLPPPPPPPERCYPDDKRALLEIKAYFGNNLSDFSTWSPQTDCCNKWTGVLCKKIPKTNTHRVNFLEIIQSDQIVGTIPSSLQNLPYLETLILRLLPNLTGPIPPFIGKLTNLQYLSLNWDSLSGPIPNFLSQLTNLATLSLNNNHFTGTIPSFLGHLPFLIGLDLYENHLTGTIPNTFGSFTHKTFIDLHNNHLSGSIPKSLGQVNFEILDLSGNQLTGDASFLFGEDKTDLAHLILSRNRLSFDFSKVVMPVGELNSSLLILDLSHNQIYGKLPDWLGEAPDLRIIDFSYNRLCGPIPTAGGGLQVFDASPFEHNLCLCGAPLPPCKS
ncbi:polygalacturonase inhibitor 1-like [Amaranthus tricolor]|uniref:polygalacturonase inhibitor 1-like n=1 Tax=Amaranthus tricolor TaxID=29722 RepID=UPI00258A5293|nr:polygalacturonase inhibitor 1-like [Amaranthus tricolor]